MKQQLEHKLKVLNIHKSAIDYKTEAITKMGAFAPFHFTEEKRDRLTDAYQHLQEIVKLLQSAKNNIPIPLLTKLEEIIKNDADSHNLYLGITILEKVLGLPLDDDKSTLLKNTFGKVVISNCNTVIFGSHLEVGENFKIEHK